MSEHEKGIDEAVRVFYGDSRYPLKAEILKDMEDAIAAYLQASGLVLLPKSATENMEKAAVAKVKPFHDQEWYRVMPKDLFRLAWPAMISAFPSPLNTIKQEDKENG